METSKVNPSLIARADKMRASSNATQLATQYVSPAVRQGVQFVDQQVDLVPTTDPNIQNAGAQGVAGLYSPHPGDWFWEQWQRTAAANNMTGGGGNFAESGSLPKLGKVFVPEQFWAYAQQKQEQAFQEDFNRFVFSQVDVTTPEGRAYWEKKFPGYTDQVYKAWQIKMMTQAKLAEIQIKGFQNEGDLWFAFQYQNGYFDRYLIPPTTRLVPNALDIPQTLTTNPIAGGQPPSAITTSMPPIPS